MRKHLLVLIPAAALVLAGCEDAGTKETLGTLGGAAAGGLIGSQIGSGSGQLIAVGAGVLIGGWLGNKIGKDLDENDRRKLEEAQAKAHEAPVGEEVTWSNPDNGHSGTVVATREGTSDSTGEYCREYQQTVTVGGETQEAYGTACRQEDGSWRVVN